MVAKREGAFVCIEGIDGSGKTTQAHRLVRTLTNKGYDAVYTTEPSKGIYGKMIRKHILRRDIRVPAIVEAVLFAADRIDHIQNEIRRLKTGRIVICDRYLYSSIAYQGASSLDPQWIKEINRHAIKPDIAIYIDVPPEIVIDRIRRRKSVMETLQTQKNVRKLYLKLVDEKQLVMLNGNVPVKELAGIIQNIVLELLEKT